MREHDEIVKDIKSILEEKVTPSVAAHNGAIGFIDFAVDTGVATLKLSGSCSGCAMSAITLKRGVEDMVAQLTSLPLSNEKFKSRGFYRLQQLEYLHENGYLSDDLFWLKSQVAI